MCHQNITNRFDFNMHSLSILSNQDLITKKIHHKSNFTNTYSVYR